MRQCHTNILIYNALEVRSKLYLKYCQFLACNTISNSNSLLKVLDILGFLPKPQKTASNKLAKLLGNFVSSAKFFLHLANMPSPPSLGITCIPIFQLVLPTCWRLNFVILAKIVGYQVLLPSPNSKLLEKASFFTWHLVLRLGKTIDLPSEF